jgi:hypothetical protein
MNLAEYFENAEERGVLATADSQERVEVAVYSRHGVGSYSVTLMFL